MEEKKICPTCGGIIQAQADPKSSLVAHLAKEKARAKRWLNGVNQHHSGESTAVRRAEAKLSKWTSWLDFLQKGGA